MRGILLAPRREWPLIAAETPRRADIYLRYVAPLAAVGAIASSVGAWLVGIPAVPYGNIPLGPGAALAGAILHFALQFAAVLVVALIVNALAPTFGGRKNPVRALQITAYSFTPAWVAAALTILPALGAIASLLGLYGLYLLYTGLPVLMQATRDRTLGYTVVIVICTVAITVAIATVSGLLLGFLTLPEIGVPEPGTARV
ncbi:MAG TPA: YIP1 family protein [Casimicrobiaceae bacterium]|nr:YIP1 family protein [Casimicrobiaceae bacterium]